MISDLISDLKLHRRSYIDCNPIFARLADGDLTRFHYLAYLRETYHLVKHTTKYLMIAANRVAENDKRLSAYFREFSVDENGHESLCIRDINALGENPDAILSGDPNPGAWGIVTQCYFWAAHGNPVALLGDAFATEELGVARGMEVARLLETNYSIPRQATNFLRLHGSEDEKHLEAAARAIERYAGDPDQYGDIIYATRMTYRYYGQLFTDVLEQGDSWSKQA
jgi:pyrroloquinoline quinone (PQQ) biosynthesis protein C